MAVRTLSRLCVTTAIIAGATVAIADESGRIALLQEWQESPLDLSRADVAELALLPGLDADLAERIDGLRSLGELRTLEDLERIPGIGTADLEAIRPYVRLGEPRRRYEVDWSLVGQDRAEATPRWKHGLQAGTGRVRLDLVVIDDGIQPRWRGAATAGVGRWQAWAGHVVLRAPGSLFAGAGARSRFSPQTLPRAAYARSRTDSGVETGWRGAVLASERGFLFAGRSPTGDPAGGASVRTTLNSLLLSGTVRVGDGPAAIALQLTRPSRTLTSWWGVLVERPSRHMWIGLRARGQLWRAGLDASSTDGALRRSVDEVSGDRLDRSHQVLQLHARMRGTGWSIGGIWRDRRRGDPGSMARSVAAEFQLVWRPRNGIGPDRVELTVRVVPVRRTTLAARFPRHPHELRARFSREVDLDAASDLVAAEYRHRFRLGEFRVSLAGVDGNASRAWMLSRPGTGVYPVWMRPPGLAAAVGWGRRIDAIGVGAWFWLRVDDGRRPDHGIGLSGTVRAGQVVRRLQGQR